MGGFVERESKLLNLKREDIIPHDISGCDAGWKQRVIRVSKALNITVQRFVYLATHCFFEDEEPEHRRRTSKAHHAWSGVQAKRNVRVMDHIRAVTAHLLYLIRMGQPLPIAG